jgi:hypothetical protein
MKTITMIGIAVALAMPALASAQRGGGAGAAGAQRVTVQRVEIQRVDRGLTTFAPGRDIVVARGRLAEIDTGTRIRRPPHNPARRRWYNANHPNHLARRRWNAANPSDADPSRRREGD